VKEDDYNGKVAPSEKTGRGQNSMAKTGQFWVAINILGRGGFSLSFIIYYSFTGVLFGVN